MRTWDVTISLPKLGTVHHSPVDRAYTIDVNGDVGGLVRGGSAADEVEALATATVDMVQRLLSPAEREALYAAGLVAAQAVRAEHFVLIAAQDAAKVRIKAVVQQVESLTGETLLPWAHDTLERIQVIFDTYENAQPELVAKARGKLMLAVSAYQEARGQIQGLT